MGTRADFYIGRGEQAEWLGSIGYDGFPENMPDKIVAAKSAAEFRDGVASKISGDTGTTPALGWPWPWNTSATTDFAYAFEGETWVSRFGSAWFRPTEEPPHENDKSAAFPDMSARKNVAWDKRSGLIVIPMRKR